MLIEEIYNRHPVTIQGNVKVIDAVKHLLKHNCNGSVVINKRNQVIGVFSLQDVAAATVPEQFQNNIQMAQAMYKPGFFAEMVRKIQNRPVKSIMRTQTVTATLQTNMMAITADFLKNDLYIVPVVDQGQLVGVITRTELKTALAKEMGIKRHKYVD